MNSGLHTEAHIFFQHRIDPVSYTHLDVYKRQVVDTVEPDPDLVKKYDEKYRKFAKIYPALKDIYSEII